MTTKKFPWKQILTIAFLGVGVFIVIEIYKAWQTGVKDLKSLLLSPFTAAGKVWSALTGWFSSLPAYKPGTVAGTGQTPAQLVGVDANSPLGQVLNSPSNVDATNAAIFGISTPASPGPVVGVWSQSSP